MTDFYDAFNIVLKSHYSIEFEYSKKIIKIFNDLTKIAPEKYSNLAKFDIISIKKAQK